MTRFGWLCVAVLAFAGCGGGGGRPGTCLGSPQVCDGVDPPGEPPPGASDSAVGLFRGSTNTGRSAHTIVLPNGEFWLLYGQGTTGTTLAGVVQGNATAGDGDISAPDMVDVSTELDAVTTGRLDGSYVTQSSIDGTLTFGSAQAGFSGTWQASSALPARVADLQGTYTGTLGTLGESEAATVQVSSSGVLAGQASSGCGFSGTLLPVTGMGLFTVSVTFGGPPCSNENTTASGVAFLDGTRLYSAGLRAGRSNGFVFTGVR